jgi:hypothetical protein
MKYPPIGPRNSGSASLPNEATDPGGAALVRQLYGHFDQARARNGIREAFAEAPTSTPLVRRAAA